MTDTSYEMPDRPYGLRVDGPIPVGDLMLMISWANNQENDRVRFSVLDHHSFCFRDPEDLIHFRLRWG